MAMLPIAHYANLTGGSNEAIYSYLVQNDLPHHKDSIDRVFVDESFLDTIFESTFGFPYSQAMTIKELASLLGRPEPKVRYEIEKGRLPLKPYSFKWASPIRTRYFFDRDEVNDWISQEPFGMKEFVKYLSTYEMTKEQYIESLEEELERVKSL